MHDSDTHSLLRTVRALFVVGLLLVIGVIGAYVLVLAPASGFVLSRSDGAWSNFGSYIGGVLGPVFAFLAFAAVIVTVHLQAKQINLSKSQAHLEELQRVIASVSKGIDDLLIQPAGRASSHAVPASEERTVFVVLSAAGTSALSTPSDYILETQRSTLVEMAKDSLVLQSGSLLIELQQLVWCLQEYEKSEGSGPVVQFYKNRYLAVVCWLDAIGLASSSKRIQDYFRPKEHRQFMVTGGV